MESTNRPNRTPTWAASPIYNAYKWRDQPGPEDDAGLVQSIQKMKEGKRKSVRDTLDEAVALILLTKAPK